MSAEFPAELRTWIREFVDRDVRPVAREQEVKLDSDVFAWSLVEQANRLGLGSLTLSEGLGGAGLGLLETAIAIEEVARGDVGIAMTLAHTLHGARILEDHGSEHQRRRLVDYVADPRALFTVVVNGRDSFMRQDRRDDLGRRKEARATRAGGGWVVEGVQEFVLNGDRARFFISFVESEAGPLCLFLENDHPGLILGPAHDTVGRRLASEAHLRFEACLVPDGQVLREHVDSVRLLHETLNVKRLLTAACAIGVAGAAMDQAVKWTRQRVQGGKPLIEHDTVAVTLGRIKMKLDAARAYVHLACAELERSSESDATLGVLPKVLASQTAWEIAVEALELHGGWGYMREVPMEKLVRDAASLVAWDEPNRHLLRSAGFIVRGNSIPIGVGV